MNKQQEDRLRSIAYISEAARENHSKTLEWGNSLAKILLNEGIWGLVDDFKYNSLTNEEKIKYWKDGVAYYTYLTSLSLPEDEMKQWWTYVDESDQVASEVQEKKSSALPLIGIFGLIGYVFIKKGI